MVFGALEPCSVCSGQLIVRTHHYQCSGNISGWTKCMETTKEAKRSPWIIPDDLMEEFDFLWDQFLSHDFLFNVTYYRAAYKYTPRVRVFQEAEESPDGPGPSQPSSSQISLWVFIVPCLSFTLSCRDPGKPLGGFSVVILGRLGRTKPAITAEVKELGGKPVTTVTPSTTICISNEGKTSRYYKSS